MASVPRVCPVSALNRAVFRPLTASKALFDSFERDLREAKCTDTPLVPVSTDQVEGGDSIIVA